MVSLRRHPGGAGRGGGGTDDEPHYVSRCLYTVYCSPDGWRRGEALFFFLVA